MRVYFDTSALAKAYWPETGSGDVEDLLAGAEATFLSDLNRLELRCMLARRSRTGELNAAQIQAAWSQFELDIASEYFELTSMPPSGWSVARELIDRVDPIALRTLDALHIAIAASLPSVTFVTADRAQRDAARLLGITTIGIALASA